jgi:AcrR family transcriptional regulator
MGTRRTPTATNRSGDPVKDPSSDLRHRILEASERLLDTEGVAALSMREVARRSGVTHQAPYHHFADREAILAELVMRGFADLTARLAQANDQIVVASLTPVFLLIGLGYLAGRLQWIREAAVKDLSNLVFLLLIPALLFRTMSAVRVRALDLRPMRGLLSGGLAPAGRVHRLARLQPPAWSWRWRARFPTW